MNQVSSQESLSNAPPPIMDSDFQITAAAEAKLVELFADAEEGLTGIRVFVSGGGCGGMSYGMTFSEDRTEYDHVLERPGFNLYVDAIAMNFLRGAEIDFVDRPSGASFVFNNVFSATGGSGTCGACGAAAGSGCAA